MSGRPLPTALKVLKGNPGKRPLNDAEPQPDKTMPEMPKGMGLIARREWKRMAAQLYLVGLLTIVDGQALKAFCLACEAAELAYKEFTREPYFDRPKLNKFEEPIMYTDPIDGKLKTFMERKVNPAFHVYSSMEKQKKSFLVEFGMSPASRSRLKIDKPKQLDDLDGVLNRRGMQVTQPAAVPGPTPIAFDAGAQDDTFTNFDA